MPVGVQIPPHKDLATEYGVSVITIKGRKVTHWRDYLDPVAVFDAVGWPAHHK